MDGTMQNDVDISMATDVMIDKPMASSSSLSSSSTSSHMYISPQIDASSSYMSNRPTMTKDDNASPRSTQASSSDDGSSVSRTASKSFDDDGSSSSGVTRSTTMTTMNTSIEASSIADTSSSDEPSTSSSSSSLTSSDDPSSMSALDRHEHHRRERAADRAAVSLAVSIAIPSSDGDDGYDAISPSAIYAAGLALPPSPPPSPPVSPSVGIISSLRSELLSANTLHAQVSGLHRSNLDLISKLESEASVARANTVDLSGINARVNTQLEHSLSQSASLLDSILLARSDPGSSESRQALQVQTQNNLSALELEKANVEVSLSGERAALQSMQISREAEALAAGEEQRRLNGIIAGLQGELASSIAKGEQLTLDLSLRTRALDDSRATCASLTLVRAELEEKLSTALLWKIKCLEAESVLALELSNHARLAQEAARVAREDQSTIRSYQSVLKRFAITVYVKEWRVRRALGTLHRRVSEMLLTTLEEHYHSAAGKESTSSSSSGAGSSGGGGKSGSGAASSAGSGAKGASSTTFRTVRKRKRAYLDHLLRPGSGNARASRLREIVLSLDDEVTKLRGPFEEIRERCTHWRATSESFFQRNIDLAAKLMNAGQAANNSAAGGGGGSGSGSASARSGSGMDGRSDPAQQHAAANVPHYASMNAATLVRHQQSDRSNSSLSRAPALGAHASHPSSESSKSKAAELDALEARCTVLRVHIAQLEGHYLTLQDSIHTFNAAAGSPALGSTGASGASSGARTIYYDSPEHQAQHAHQSQLSQAAGSSAPRTSLEFADRFDPALVSPIPFPTFASGGGTANQGGSLLVPTPPSSSSPSHPHPPIVLSPSRPLVAGLPIPPLFQSMSYATPQRGYQFTVGAGAAPSYATSKPDVISLRALREQNNGGTGHMTQQQQRSMFPSLGTPYAGPLNPYPSLPLSLSSPPYMTPQQHSTPYYAYPPSPMSTPMMMPHQPPTSNLSPPMRPMISFSARGTQ